MTNKLCISVIGWVLIGSTAYAAHLHKEKEYQNLWCSQHNGITEYILDDGARVDCLTDEYAIEVDFAPKWAEAVGQSLYYAEKTRKKAGIVLIIEKEETNHLSRLLLIAEKYSIKIWVIRPSDLEGQNE